MRYDVSMRVLLCGLSFAVLVTATGCPTSTPTGGGGTGGDKAPQVATGEQPQEELVEDEAAVKALTEAGAILTRDSSGRVTEVELHSDRELICNSRFRCRGNRNIEREAGTVENKPAVMHLPIRDLTLELECMPFQPVDPTGDAGINPF